MSVRTSPTVRRRRLGYELRQLRMSTGRTIDQVAKELECSESKISRIETGQVTALPRDVGDMLRLYDVGDEQRNELMQLARDARRTEWWRAYSGVPRSAYIGLEAAAEQISTYESMLVPGLLQTPAYTRSTLRRVYPNLSAEDIEQQVRARNRRQTLLTSDDPPTLRAVLDEAVVRHTVGGPETMREQLHHLADVAELPAVTIQVVPFSVGAHPGLCGSFTIMTFRDQPQPDVVYFEQMNRESFLEAPEEIRQYKTAFDALSRVALPPDDSIAFLSALGKGSYP